MTEARRWLEIAGAAFSLELRRLASNRAAVAVTLLMPTAIAMLVGLALANVSAQTVRLGYVRGEQNPISQVFEREVLGELRKDPRISVEPLATEEIAHSEIARGKVGAAFVVTRDASGNRTDIGAIQVLEGDAFASAAAATIAESFNLRVRAARLTGSTAALGRPSVSFSSPGGRRLSAATYWGPALGGFLVLLGLGYGAQRLVSDRRTGVRARLVAAPGGGSGALAGQVIAGVAVGATGLVILVIVGTLVEGESWGPTTSVALIVLATALAVGGVAMIVAGLARTPGQAQSLTALVAFGLAIGGGNFATPSSTLGPSRFASWLPTAQSLEAFSRTITNHASPSELLGPLTILTGTGLACGAIGLVFERRFR